MCCEASMMFHSPEVLQSYRSLSLFLQGLCHLIRESTMMECARVWTWFFDRSDLCVTNEIVFREGKIFFPVKKMRFFFGEKEREKKQISVFCRQTNIGKKMKNLISLPWSGLFSEADGLDPKNTVQLSWHNCWMLANELLFFHHLSVSRSLCHKGKKWPWISYVYGNKQKRKTSLFFCL